MATALVNAPSSPTRADRARMHARMIDDGWSPDDIAAVEAILLRAALHDTYLAAGYSPDDVDAVISLY